MLSFEENSWNLAAIKFLSWCNLLPLEINVETGEVKIQSKWWRRWIWKFYYLLLTIWWIYLAARFVQTILNPELFNLSHFLIHFLFVVGILCLCVLGYILFLANLEELTLIASRVTMKTDSNLQLDDYVATEIIGAGENDSSQIQNSSGQVKAEDENAEKKAQMIEGQKIQLPSAIRPLLTLPPKYNLQELLSRFIFLVLVLSHAIGTGILAIDPTRPQLFYSSLPPEFQNIATFWTLLAFESFCLATGLLVAYIFLFVQLQFLEKIQHEFKRLSHSLKNLNGGGVSRTNFRDIEGNCEVIRVILDQMKQLVGLIQLFNRVFPFSIFAFKLVIMFIGVLGSFCAIRLIRSHPATGSFMAYFATVASLVYCILYQKAFVIPDKIEELKQEILETAHRLLKLRDLTAFKCPKNPRGQGIHPLTWAEVKMEVRSMRNVGIRVGSFHTMERMSSPLFINFVIQQVVNLLVLFPEGQIF